MSVFSVLADVLMVGHSLFGGNLPVLTEEALRQMQGPAVVEAQIINGADEGGMVSLQLLCAAAKLMALTLEGQGASLDLLALHSEP